MTARRAALARFRIGVFRRVYAGGGDTRAIDAAMVAEAFEAGRTAEEAAARELSRLGRYEPPCEACAEGEAGTAIASARTPPPFSWGRRQTGGRYDGQ